MGYKTVHIDVKTDKLLLQCIDEFLHHHPEMKHIRISRNKIIAEMAEFYLRA